MGSIVETKRKYESAYHSLLELVSKVIDHADLERVTKYITQP